MRKKGGFFFPPPYLPYSNIALCQGDMLVRLKRNRRFKACNWHLCSLCARRLTRKAGNFSLIGDLVFVAHFRLKAVPLRLNVGSRRKASVCQ